MNVYRDKTVDLTRETDSKYKDIWSQINSLHFDDIAINIERYPMTEELEDFCKKNGIKMKNDL